MCGRLCGCSVWMGVSGEWMCGRLCGCSVWMGVSGEWMCVEGCVGVVCGWV